MPLLIIVLGLIIAAAAVLLIPVKIHISYRRKKSDDNLYIEYSALKGLFSRNINVPLIEIQNGKLEPVLNIIKELSTSFLRKKTTEKEIEKLDAGEAWRKKRKYNYLLKKAIVEKIEWYTDIGVGDAAKTGILAGLVWILKGISLDYLKNNARELGKKTIEVIPHYDCNMFATRIDCIFILRIGHIMLARLRG